MNDKQLENYLFKIVNETLSYFEIEKTNEEIADLVMLTLINIEQN
jgi:hypothetical protein